MSNMQDRLLDVSVVAQKLKVSTQTVYRLMWGGHISFIKVGARKGYRIKEADLEAFLKKREEETAYE